MRRKRNPSLMDQLRENASVLAMGGAMLSTALLLISRIATKEYVDEQDKVVTARANAYADANKNANLIEIKQMGADVKAISAKTDILLIELQKKP